MTINISQKYDWYNCTTLYHPPVVHLGCCFIYSLRIAVPLCNTPLYNHSGTVPNIIAESVFTTHSLLAFVLLYG